MTRKFISFVDRIPDQREPGPTPARVTDGTAFEKRNLGKLLQWIDKLDKMNAGPENLSVTARRIIGSGDGGNLLKERALVLDRMGACLDDGDKAAVALNSDGVLSVVVKPGRSVPIDREADRIDRVQNLARLIAWLARRSRGGAQDSMIDLRVNDGAILIPAAHLPPVRVDLPAGSTGEPLALAKTLLDETEATRDVWRLARRGWVGDQRTVPAAIDERIDHLMRLHFDTLDRLREPQVERKMREMLTAQQNGFDRAVKTWTWMAVASAFLIVVPVLCSGLFSSETQPGNLALVGFTRETLTVHCVLSAVLCACLWRMMPLNGSREPVQAWGKWRSICCVLCLIAMMLCVVLLQVTPLWNWLPTGVSPPQAWRFRDMPEDGTTAYFFKSVLGTVWLIPVLCMVFLWAWWRELDTARHDLRGSLAPLTNMLGGLERAIRRNDPGRSEVQVAARFGSEIAPRRAALQERADRHAQLMQRRGAAILLIGTSAAFLGPLKSLQPTFLPEDPPAITGPLVSVGDIRLAPAVRLEPTVRMALTATQHQAPVAISGPMLSVGDVRTAPVISLTAPATVEPDGVSGAQVEAAAARIEAAVGRMVQVVVIQQGEQRAATARTSSGLSDLPALADCERQPIATVHFPSANVRLEDATVRRRDGSESRETTSVLSQLLAGNPGGQTVLVVGHADPTGDPAQNLRLSQQRAWAVRAAIDERIGNLAPPVGIGPLEWLAGGPLSSPEESALEDARRVDIFLCGSQTEQASAP